MPKSFDETESESAQVCAMLVGDAGAGKTGSLCALAEAGFELRILDLDGNLAPMRAALSKEARKNVSFHTFTGGTKFDPRNMTAAPGKRPKVLENAMKAMDNWNFDDTSLEKLPVEEAGSNVVYVTDSLSFLGRACMNYVLNVEARVGQPPRIQDWGAAGGWLTAFVENFFGAETSAHMLVITHLTLVEIGETGISKYYPKALSKGTDTEVAKFVDTMLLYQLSGQGESAKRVIRTTPTSLFPTKAPADIDGTLGDKLSQKTGLLEYFVKAGAQMPNPEAGQAFLEKHAKPKSGKGAPKSSAKRTGGSTPPPPNS